MIISAVAYLLIGLVLGFAYFHMLNLLVAGYMTEGSLRWLLISAIARIAVAAVVLWFVAKLGGGIALLTCLLGFLLGRIIVQRSVTAT